MRSAFLCDFTQRILVDAYRRNLHIGYKRVNQLKLCNTEVCICYEIRTQHIKTILTPFRIVNIKPGGT